MSRFVVENAEDTKLLAQTIAKYLRSGDLVILSGDLGTGKTVFARALLASMGVKEVVTSPTFVLVKSYQGVIPIDHIDIYRIYDPDELDILCIGDLLEDGHAVVIEWGERAIGLLGPSYIQITFERLESEISIDEEVAGAAKRFVTVDFNGPRFRDRARQLEAEIETIWSVA
ncbi:MAG: tRNA (adenosine(37)-N6)-threonylcarbamoyltransferase complex ATPase subunit type 1 TsaE [Actinomycetota bacterium]|nr:MAG: tRNA (adenosine(37)-N6)-threonylcarbamoyltransferase complex ATPase subunit type 1 TsaE [Actinomycetota bacterium]